MGETKKPIFRDLTAEDDDIPEITEIESMCMSCEENGTTRLLLTKIPFFRDVIIMAFTCPHCGYRDNQIKPGGDIQEKGVKITFKVDGAKMMNRQIVKQGSAMVRIEELDFEAPAFTSKGSLTTVEGILENAASGLEEQQPVRRIMQPEIAEKIDEIIATLTKYRGGEIPFTLVLEDTSGLVLLKIRLLQATTLPSRWNTLPGPKNRTRSWDWLRLPKKKRKKKRPR